MFTYLLSIKASNLWAVNIVLFTNISMTVGLFYKRVVLADPDFDEPALVEGDIAVSSDANKNADPCTTRGCLWKKWTDGKVYIPYYIANHFCKHFIFFLLILIYGDTAQQCFSLLFIIS